MTFKEQLIKDYPWLYAENVAETIKEKCPSELGFISRKAESKLCDEVHCDCKKCWNREMPNTEPKTDMDKEDYYNVGYIKGLEDAWELARKIFTTDCTTLQKVFGHSDEGQIIMTITPQEALAKLKAYEDSKIEVGDILLIYGEEAVVTRIVEGYAYVLFSDGTTNNWLVEDLAGDKTGKHLEIKAFLEQIGE